MLAPDIQSKPAASKREEVKAFLCEEARAIGAGNKLPTVLELCSRLGVAKATVNSALEELEGEGIVWRRKGSGIFVSEQIAQKRIGLIFGGNIFEAGRSPIDSILLNCSRERAASHGEAFSFYLDVPTAGGDRSFPVHEDLVDALARKRLHGMLLLSRRSVEQEVWLRAQGVPLVSMTVGASETPCAALDYAEIARLGVRSLAEQGCRRIGLISALCLSSQGRAQAAVYRKALAELGLPVRPERVWQQPGTEVSDPAHGTRGEQGYSALMKLMEAEALDGVVINDDMMTIGALAAAKKLGLKVGADLKIATHANQGSSALREHESSLTLLEIDPNEFVEAMFGMLECLMAGGETTLEPRLILPKLRVATQIAIS